MQESATYSVVLSGKIKSGFESNEVIDAFANLFKLPLEKAEKLVGTSFVIKKEVELKVAKNYKDRLSAIGLDVALKRHGGIDALSLEPVPEKEEQPEQMAETQQAATATKPPVPGVMICPKCNLEQSKAEECSGCGVIVQKVLQAQTNAPEAKANANPQKWDEVDDEASIDGDTKPTWKFLVAPAGAAILGALVWYFLSVSLGYEFGFIAWAIGGAVGYAAFMSGARGEAVGVACAILVVLSIFGGKYMAASAFQNGFLEEIQNPDQTESEGWKQVYEIETAEARAFARLDGSDESLRQFLFDHEYSESEQVTQAEIEDFIIHTQPRLHFIIENKPSYEEWLKVSLYETIGDLSAFDLMIESLGWMDILFLFLGVGTAYRLSSQGSARG